VQFLLQMFNVSALLLDDALLKCVVTEVVSFSIIVAFETLTFHKVVRCSGIFSDSIITNFLLINSKIRLKIGQYLMKLMRTKMVPLLATPL